MLIKRRAVVKSAVYGGAAVGAWPLFLRRALANSEVIDHFPHGVASGDPTSEGVVIWTRVTSKKSAAEVKWQISKMPDFAKVERSGVAQTSAKDDFCIKVEASNLQPGQTYYYRFSYQGVDSEPGRTKTLPVGKLDQVGFALASCSNYPFGYFNAYEAIALDESIDYVVHLGDYIYEYGQDEWGGSVGKTLAREHRPKHETVTLDDYRLRHAQYKGDIHSRMMHASHPLIVIWDDHETTNNPYLCGVQNHQPETEGDWSKRRDASLKAYYEWMPIRDPKDAKDRASLWRAFEFGDLATLLTLETRHTGRTKQIDYAEHLPNIKSDEDLANFTHNILGDSHREMLSGEMKAFAKKALFDSSQKNKPWNIIGNQIPMARTLVPQLPESTKTGKNNIDPVSAERAQFQRLGELGLPIYLDTWDGYPVARQRFYELCQKCGVEDLVVFTGDSHSFWLNQLQDDQGKAMGVELGTAGISSPGDFEEFGPTIAKLMDQLLVERNEEITWTDGLHRGYVRAVFRPKTAHIDYVSVSTVRSPKYSTSVIKSVALHKTKKGIAIA